MVRFYGNAAAKVDDKGRIVFPAIYRDAMARSGESDLTLIVKRSVQGNCLNLYTLEALCEELRRRGLKRFPIHIKLDTGMHRLGFFSMSFPTENWAA